MELKFESLGELDQFMQFCAHVGRQIVGGEPVQSVDHTADFYRAPVADDTPEVSAEESIAERERQNTVNEAFIAETVAANAEAAKPKRTRRTKAEMEAARAVDTPPAYDTPEGAQHVAAAHDAAQPEPEPRGNPFAASPSTQAILDAPNQSAATLAGMAAMQQGVGETMPAAPATRQQRIMRIMAEGVLTDSLAHLKHCQKFIQSHGMAVYEKSFADGLTTNIAVYTAEQCALHVAILEELAA